MARPLRIDYAVKGEWLRKRGRSREQPSLWVLERVAPVKVLGTVAQYFKLRPEELGGSAAAFGINGGWRWR
jgi:hypothetical protein